MLPLKFLLTHYDAAERLSEIHTLLAEDPDFKWILAERRMLPFMLHSFKICFKNTFKIKFLFSQNFEPLPHKWKVILQFGFLSWLLIALASLKMMVSLQQTRRSQPIGLSISKQWISWTDMLLFQPDQSQNISENQYEVLLYSEAFISHKASPTFYTHIAMDYATPGYQTQLQML